MEAPNARSGEIISLVESSPGFGSGTTILLKTPCLEVLRIQLRAGEEIPTHRTSGDATLQCVWGSAYAYAWNRTRELRGGELLYLPCGSLYSVSGNVDSVLLITTQLTGELPVAAGRIDKVPEASEESFPASDAPSWTPVIGP